MSQHDLSIANQGFPAFRSDLNDALQALGSLNSGTSAPSTTYANMPWYDTTNNILKIRNEDNDAWISILELNQTTDAVARIILAALKSTGTSLTVEDSSGNTIATIAQGDILVAGTSTSAGSISLAEDTDNGTNKVVLKAAASIASNVTFVLPSADGSSGQALVTDGSGNLSFASAGGDKITEGNSSVEVVDTGTGYVVTTVDGVEIIRAVSNSVGIGVTTSSWGGSAKVLEIGGDASNGGYISNLGSGGFLSLTQNAYQNGTNYIYKNNGQATNYYTQGGYFYWQKANTGTAGGTISFTTYMELDDNANLKFNSGYGSAATAYACRAWVNFSSNGTIRASGNVSSVTQNTTGDFTINFTNSMPDTNYSASMSMRRGGTNDVLFACPFGVSSGTAFSTGSLRIRVFNQGPTAENPETASVQIFR